MEKPFGERAIQGAHIVREYDPPHTPAWEPPPLILSNIGFRAHNIDTQISCVFIVDEGTEALFCSI